MQIPTPLIGPLQLLPDPCFAGGLSEIDDCPRIGGIYLLIIQLEQSIDVAKPQATTLPASTYFYAGSAFGPGGLRARIRRHLKRDKTIRWHVDQLTTRAQAVSALGWTGGLGSKGGKECDLVDLLETLLPHAHPVTGFGSSDCPKCTSHLIAFN